jgi:hypothetical protein
MNPQHPFLESDIESQRLDTGSQIMHLIAGLERQKKELGPIADELISLLHRLGVDISSSASLPQADDKSHTGKP